MIITIDRGNGIEEMEDSLLEKKEGETENENETTRFVEYYLNGQLVHRSVHVVLKEGFTAEGVAAMLG